MLLFLASSRSLEARAERWDALATIEPVDLSRFMVDDLIRNSEIMGNQGIGCPLGLRRRHKSRHKLVIGDEAIPIGVGRGEND